MTAITHTTESQATATDQAPSPTPADVASAFEYHHELTGADVVEVAELLGIDLATAPFSVQDLLLGLEVERDLGYECAPSVADGPDDDLVELCALAVAHLAEQRDYYDQMTQVRAPGDGAMPALAGHDVGTD